MPKLVTKFKYLKPSARQSRGGYAKYIATREGVEKLDDSQKFAPVTAKQKKLIAKILRDFPDSREMFEYEDYLQNQTVGAASEFITRAIEDNADRCLASKTYADYIATRPRAERFGSHGLFTDDGVQVNLDKVSTDLNSYAQYLLNSLNRTPEPQNWSVTSSALTLMRQTASIFQDRFRDLDTQYAHHIDRKLMSKIAEKKLAQGQKLGG